MLIAIILFLAIFKYYVKHNPLYYRHDHITQYIYTPTTELSQPAETTPLSAPSTTAPTTTAPTMNNSTGNNTEGRTPHNGLAGGAVAAIIMVLIIIGTAVAIITVVVVVWYKKRDTFSMNNDGQSKSEISMGE